MNDDLLCMMCGKNPLHSEGPDEYGDDWCYCKDCDCWTSHPPKKENEQWHCSTQVDSR